ncbi:GNAT family N-acetyltransferase [Alkaliphilus pronyensis]|uniref:GNAT family N-acetyltransferase n=1 Tax=Alkaliphilus pronyensis TaxID=1482732 RepID=A0A6I0FCG2_9FIRM|nr:GNAT family N-acetyltransferase [Alkaliphilus pronyensis]KAB3531038.1 GNAT family N-acetyltransferase [Alkaliphilus pronyensis]
MVNRIEALEYLKKDIIKNVSIVNFIESYECSLIERVGESVLVKGKSDRNWVYISSKSEKELLKIKDILREEDREFAVIENWMLPILTYGKEVKWKLSSMRLYLPPKAAVNRPREITDNLTVDDAEYIYNNSDYKEYLSVDYITERIVNGVGSCIRDNGKPVGWALTQDDGAIGFLHVMPDFRKMGFATDITLDIIKKIRKQGELPFVHIEENNTASMNLAFGIGFVLHEVVSWFELEA